MKKVILISFAVAIVFFTGHFAVRGAEMGEREKQELLNQKFLDAVVESNWQEIDRALVRNADVNAKKTQGRYCGDTALIIAVREQNIGAVNTLVREPDIDLSMRGNTGQTALEVAQDLLITQSMNSCPNVDSIIQILQLLVSAPENLEKIRVPEKRQNILNGKFFNAVLNGDFEGADLLLKRGAELNALHVGARSPGDTLLTFIIKNFLNLTAIDEAIQYLLQKPDIDIFIKNAEGETAFELARERGLSKIVKLLEEHIEKRRAEIEKRRADEEQALIEVLSIPSVAEIVAEYSTLPKTRKPPYTAEQKEREEELARQQAAKIEADEKCENEEKKKE